jgi:hypothetical protein
MTWHTDRHFVDPLPRSTDPRPYLVAFINDSSRYVVHSEMLPNTSIAGTAHGWLSARPRSE